MTLRCLALCTVLAAVSGCPTPPPEPGADATSGTSETPTGSGSMTSVGMSTASTTVTSATTVEPSTSSSSTDATSGSTDAMSSSGSGSGSGSSSSGVAEGCTAIDVLFVLDSSIEVAEERDALAESTAFAGVLTALMDVAPGVEVRVGVTDDNDNGFYVPAGWGGADPFFDAPLLDEPEIQQAFHDAVAQFGTPPDTELGCEHVLTSAVDLLDGDATGFVRDDALLVLVLVTDVDDYGAYDQLGGNTCSMGCTTPPPEVSDLVSRLVNDVKGGRAESVAAIVVAGNPSLDAGTNVCGQPLSCACGTTCDVYHADRLWDFVELLGDNAETLTLCDPEEDLGLPGAIESTIADACAAL